MKFPKSNLHTHTSFCDGKNTPEEMVDAALRLGMNTLGFSAHEEPVFSDIYMPKDRFEVYRGEVMTLKEKYRDKICILLGTERDFYAEKNEEAFDYVIGSVHFISADGEYCPVDLDADFIRNFVAAHFDGDMGRYVKTYYESVASVVKKTKCNIVGHFDLINKFNETEGLFDENAHQNLRYAMDALDALLEENVLFEINTGAICRGYRRIPYPAPMFLHRIAEKRGRVILSSDAHSKNALMCGFGDAVQYAKSCGIGCVYAREGDTYKPFRL